MPEARHRVIPKAEQHEHSAVRNYVRDLILGFNDGLVSVYAIVAGVTGAAFTTGNIAIAGVAAAVAGAISMGLGEYLSTKGQVEFYEAERERERDHIQRFRAVEVQEVRDILQEKDYPEHLIEETVDHVTADDDRFLDFMMREEFGVGTESERSPIIAMGLVMVAFVVGAVPPVLPFFIVEDAFVGLGLATVLSLGGAAVAGAVRGQVSGIAPWKTGLEMVLLGAVAAAITFGVGTAFGLAAG